MKRLWALVGISILLACVVGCAGGIHSNFRELEIGYNQDKVLEVLGEPYSTASFLVGESKKEYWYYITEPPLGPLMDRNFSVLSFEDDALVAWGKRRR